MSTASLPEDVVEAADRSACPGPVLIGLRRLVDAHPDAASRLADSQALRDVVVSVFAASRSLTQVCLTVPSALDILSDLETRPACDPADGDALVSWKRKELLRIAARDLTGWDGLEAVGEALSVMADDVLTASWRLTGQRDVAVIAMGKYGGRELNYSSDVDVLFVGGGDVRAPLTMAQRCFRVDADLRPEGRDGPLVRTLEAYESYWDRWAKTWEFQALLKSRPAAGDDDLGGAFAAAASARVWTRPFGPEEVREVRAMKARAEGEMARRGLTDRELKRGRGGIRDIEFAVQLLQMVHGRADASLRSPTTLVALGVLASAGYIDATDGEGLSAAYRVLRTVEHRLQLWDEAQVHAVPAAGEALERLARVCGFRGSVHRDAVTAFLGDLRHHQNAARAIHERLFFRPLLEAFGGAALSPISTTMSRSAVTDRLTAFGFASADRTGEALAELTRGLTRTSRLMQQVLPLLLEWLSESPDPDGGLLALRTLASGPHRSEQLARMFRDAPDGARRLCSLVGSSRLIATGLERHPELVADLAEPSHPLPVDGEDLRRRIAGTLAWRGDASRIGALRRLRQHEELRIAVRDILNRDEVDAVAASLTTLAEAVLAEALAVALDISGTDVPIAVVAMGRFGGAELSYASDLDVMIVHGGTSDAEAAEAERLAGELRRLVNGVTPTERLYPLDFDLRPEGRQGPLARSLAGYEQYYEHWAQTWERQALLRGRFAVGDAGIGGRFAALARDFLGRSVTPDDEREIRRVKARIERERIPAGDDPDFHLKLGRGGLSDVEWTVQLLQLRHRVLGFPGTLAALAELAANGHIDAADAEVLRAAYLYCERTRNRLYLVRGALGDALPSRPDQLTKLARSLAMTGPELREEYRRVTRRAREVTERVFYGAEGPARRPGLPRTDRT
ncbi:MAG: bifunctional [glutamine synthetase] adenylyltransferase/[glutamine synthetase]-adenylyl-L-tyrosine phosphorylase [Acidimicrobiales bacterium]